MLIEEPVAGVGVDLNVVVDSVGGEGSLQPVGGAVAHRGAVLAAITGHDWTGSSQQTFGVFGAAPVVAAGGGKPATRSERQGVAAAHAEANYTDLAGAVLQVAQEGARGLDVSNVRPCRVPNSRMMVRRQRSMLPHQYWSGAAAT